MAVASLLALCGTLLGACAGGAREPSEADAPEAAVPLRADDAEIAARLRAAIDEEAGSGFSGVVLIAHGEELLVDAAYPSSGESSIDTRSRFVISSMAKQFVAAAVLRLRERGALRLEDTVRSFFPNAPADKAPITILQLLSHQSGFGQSYAGESAATSEEGARRLLGETLVDEPGSAFHYSNANYELLVAIVEKVTGRSYRRFLTDELLSRAELHDTGFSDADSWASLVPTAGALPERLKTDNWGGGGMYSTSHDLWSWVRALRAGRLLDAASVASLFDPVVDIKEGQGALGWFVGTTESGVSRIFTRGNDDFGPNSLLYVYPDRGVVVIVLTHGGDKDGELSWSRALSKRVEAVLFPG